MSSFILEGVFTEFLTVKNSILRLEYLNQGGRRSSQIEAKLQVCGNLQKQCNLSFTDIIFSGVLRKNG